MFDLDFYSLANYLKLIIPIYPSEEDMNCLIEELTVKDFNKIFNKFN